LQQFKAQIISFEIQPFRLKVLRIGIDFKIGLLPVRNQQLTLNGFEHYSEQHSDIRHDIDEQFLGKRVH
jgi:hypothetical protein